MGFYKIRFIVFFVWIKLWVCPMHLDGHCPGCGGGEGNQSCKIARCSLQHRKPEYCSQCQEFPCEKYEYIDAFDLFVTHQNQKKEFLLRVCKFIPASNGPSSRACADIWRMPRGSVLMEQDIRKNHHGKGDYSITYNIYKFLILLLISTVF